MERKEKEKADEKRKRVLEELEKIAFEEKDMKPGERMKALELLGKPLGLWKDVPPDDGTAGELTKLSELLEQRRKRRKST